MLHDEILRLSHTKGPQNLYCLFYAPYQRSTIHSDHNLENHTGVNENHLRYHGLEFLLSSSVPYSVRRNRSRQSKRPVEFNLCHLSQTTDIAQQVVSEYVVAWIRRMQKWKYKYSSTPSQPRH